jgi:chaperonin GroEL
MLVRHVAWQTYQQAGDGSATAAVIAAHLLSEAESLLAAGIRPREIAAAYQHCLKVALAALAKSVSPLEGKVDLARFLAGLLPEPGLSEMLAEIMVSADEDAAVLVEESSTTETAHEYVDGMRWDKGWLPAFAATTSATRRLDDPRVLVTTQAVDTAAQARAIIAVAGASGPANLLIVASSVSDTAAAYFNVNRNGAFLKDVVVAGLEGIGHLRHQICEDIAAGTGGHCIQAETGVRLEDVTARDFGKARLAWVRRNQSAILGGRGARADLRARLAEARAELRAADGDAVLQANLRKRIGRLSGATAVIMVGGRTESERASLRTRVEAAVQTARGARQGVVPGGGAALVRAAAAISISANGAGPAAASCMRAFAKAVSEPMRLIAVNAGLDPTMMIANAVGRSGEVFDVVRLAWHPVGTGSIVDAAAVVTTALKLAVHVVATAVGTAAIVHAAQRERGVEP